MATIYDEAVEARRRAYVRVLLIQGTDRFGAPDAATESKLNAIEEYDRLELMCRSIYKVNSWQELLAIDY